MLAGRQKKALRGMAHGLEPVGQIGRGGLTDGVLASLDQALEHHELIKVRFLDHKDRKRALADAMAERLDAEVAGLIGHVAILYRPARDPDRRRIVPPG